jgi:hypothetical protein
MLRRARDLVGEVEEFGAAAAFLDYCHDVDGQPPAPTGSGGAGKAEATPTINGDREPIGGGRIPIEGPAARAYCSL